MKLVIGFLQILLSCLTIYTQPLSFSEQTEQSVSIVEESSSSCEPVQNAPCAGLYSSAQFPNLYGHTSLKVATENMTVILNSLSKQSSALISFICTLYLPPCYDNSTRPDDLVDRKRIPHLPCRTMCDKAVEEVRPLINFEQQPWSVKCQTLPTENCFNYIRPDSIELVKETISTTPIRNLNNNIINFAPLDVELGNDEGYDVEVVSLSNSHIPERRYDIANLGDPDLFQGWADVQGNGAANDYCRVIGKGKRRFLSCNLAGRTGQGQHYVSKLGFDVGHPNTWFMRDMDGDGKDDYCRCVGQKTNSKITCMKAGENGFYGSTIQGGDQYTFTLPMSDSCVSKRVNPAFGEAIA